MKFDLKSSYWGMNKVFAICTGFIILIFHAACQTKTPDKQMAVNHPVGNYINLPASHLAIIPPAGYQLAANECLLVSDKSRQREGADIGYVEFTRPFLIKKREDFINDSIIVLEGVKVNGYDGQYLELLNELTGFTAEVSFGDSSFEADLYSIGTNESAFEKKVFKQSFLSARYDKGKAVNPFELAPFSLDDSKSNFKLVNAHACHSFTYSDNIEKKDIYTIRDNYLDVRVMKGYSVTIDGLMMQEEERLKLLHAQNLKAKEIRIEKNKEILISEGGFTFDLDGKKFDSYVATVANTGVRLIFNGCTHGSILKDEVEFKRLARSVIFKP